MHRGCQKNAQELINPKGGEETHRKKNTQRGQRNTRCTGKERGGAEKHRNFKIKYGWKEGGKEKNKDTNMYKATVGDISRTFAQSLVKGGKSE